MRKQVPESRDSVMTVSRRRRHRALEGKQPHRESSVCLQDCEIAAPYDSRATEAMMASP
jgi:hypothetical protein